MQAVWLRDPVKASVCLLTIALTRRTFADKVMTLLFNMLTPVFLPGESQGRGSLVGGHLWGHTELETTEVT